MANDLYEKKLIIDDKEIQIKKVLEESDKIIKEKLFYENLFKIRFAKNL
jgi:hypothetical protein